MNDDNKNVNQNPNPVDQADQVQPQIPVGTIHKEMGPPIAVVSEIKPAGTEVKHDISKESAEVGVKETSDSPDLTQVADIRHAGPFVPVSTQPLGSIKFQMSEDEIADKLKTGQDDDSGKWLARLINKVIAVMGLKIN